MSDLFLIPQALLTDLHNYLMTRPMGEVEQFAVGLRRAPPFVPPKPSQDEEGQPEGPAEEQQETPAEAEPAPKPRRGKSRSAEESIPPNAMV